MIGIAALMLLAVTFAAISYVIARVDRGRGLYHPFRRPLNVAIFATIGMMAVISYITVQQASGNAVGSLVGITWSTAGLVFVFAFSWVTGMVGYRIGHNGRDHMRQDVDDEPPKTRIKETGNPYQPPST